MRLLRILAFPISLVYALVVHVRNWLYDVGFFKSKQFSTPIITIGNLSTGGTGKTPMVSFLIQLLDKDLKVAMLSRGYGRESNGFIMAERKSTARDIGDEPLQLFKKHPSLLVAVDADRRHGIQILEEKAHPDVIILDDAFQHRKVRPHCSVLLTSYDSLYIDDWYVPTGNLRDAKNQAKRADVIAVTKCPEHLSDGEKKRIINKLKPRPYQNIIFGMLAYAEILKGELGKTTLKDVRKKKRIGLVTGIANPKPLVQYLQKKGIVFEHFEYADHHFFTDKQIKSFAALDVILTTEKDYARLDGRLANAYVIEVRHSFSEVDTKLLKERIENVMKLHLEA